MRIWDYLDGLRYIFLVIFAAYMIKWIVKYYESLFEILTFQCRDSIFLAIVLWVCIIIGSVSVVSFFL